VIPATREQQLQLVELQEVDSRIRQLEHRRADLPEQRALDENADMLQAIAAEYATTKENLEVAERKQKRLEEEINTVESRRKSEEGRMYSGLITSSKELEALRAEIASLRSRKSTLEDELLDVMERVEELTGMVESLKARHEELTGKADELKKARDEAATEIDAELAERKAERERGAAGVAPELLETYLDMRERKGGVAVAQLEGRTCSGCRIELTAIELEEVREHAAEGIARCAQCNRLLVIP
jgi:uncharacterized protein